MAIFRLRLLFIGFTANTISVTVEFSYYFFCIGTSTTLTVTYLLEGGDPVTVEYPIGAERRLTIVASDDVPGRDFSTRILTQSSMVRVVAERTMTGPADSQMDKWGHTALGVTKESSAWYFAEGAVHSSFETFVLLANTQQNPAQVTLTFLLA